ncbi:MAG: hypothetical protein JWR80_8265 [Bradyrhizobium sp.]|nr:hypothetical protein [Bradyrhizobium sp.]
MLYELTTYDLKPRTLPLVEKLFGDAYASLGKPAEFIASLHTEFGPLNQVVQIWKYEDADHRARILRSNAQAGFWPPDIGAHIVMAKTEIMKPVAMSRELSAGTLGPYIELRTYTFPLGEFDRMMDAWERAMPMRDELGSPAAAIWISEIGVLNSLTHIWPYRSLQDREEIRKKVREKGMWPPYKHAEAEGRPGYEILTQENKLLLPAAFSPLQ